MTSASFLPSFLRAGKEASRSDAAARIRFDHWAREHIRVGPGMREGGRPNKTTLKDRSLFCTLHFPARPLLLLLLLFHFIQICAALFIIQEALPGSVSMYGERAASSDDRIPRLSSRLLRKDGQGGREAD